jgi:lipopolysaccharide transport system ATP-binding protein
VIVVLVNKRVDDLTIGFMIKDRLGNEVFGTNTHHMGLSEKLDSLVEGSRLKLKLKIDPLGLGEGSYNITVAAHALDSHLAKNYDWLDQAVTIDVGRSNFPRFAGVVRLPVTAEIVDPL